MVGVCIIEGGRAGTWKGESSWWFAEGKSIGHLGRAWFDLDVCHGKAVEIGLQHLKKMILATKACWIDCTGSYMGNLFPFLLLSFIGTISIHIDQARSLDLLTIQPSLTLTPNSYHIKTLLTAIIPMGSQRPSWTPSSTHHQPHHQQPCGRNFQWR